MKNQKGVGKSKTQRNPDSPLKAFVENGRNSKRKREEIATPSKSPERSPVPAAQRKNLAPPVQKREVPAFLLQKPKDSSQKPDEKPKKKAQKDEIEKALKAWPCKSKTEKEAKPESVKK